MLNRRHSFLLLVGLLPFFLQTTATAKTAATKSTAKTNQPKKQPPNIVVLFADDMGYGDLSCFGHPTIRTPHLDRMATEGMKWTQFYVAAAVCTPSRAALITGRLPVRNGMCDDRYRVLNPTSYKGLPASELTLAEGLKSKGYATACIGKWHLGHLPPYLPTRCGFDSYYGIPYSNDMGAPYDKNGKKIPPGPKPKTAGARGPSCPLMRGEKIIEQPADQRTITKRYTEEAVKFLNANQKKPFFLYLPYSLPHIPLFRSEKFAGKSVRGTYGDVIEEIDWSVGQILQTLKKLKLDKNTIVWFTSDNGPWLPYKTKGGSAGLLRDGKGSTWEGGMREPTVVWWPGTIKPGTICTELGSTMDIYTTSFKLAGVPLPKDRIIDGLDLTPVLKGTGKSPRKTLFYYRGTRVMAIRKGAFKVHFATQPGYGKLEEQNPPLLYNLDHDPSEKYDIAKKHADVIADIRKELAAHIAKRKMMPSQLRFKSVKRKRKPAQKEKKPAS